MIVTAFVIIHYHVYQRSYIIINFCIAGSCCGIATSEPTHTISRWAWTRRIGRSSLTVQRLPVVRGSTSPFPGVQVQCTWVHWLQSSSKVYLWSCDHFLELALLEVELIVFFKSKYLVLLQLSSFELSELTTPPTRSSTAFTSNALQSAISEEVKILARTTRALNTVPNLRSQHRQQRPAVKNRPGMRTLTTSTRMEQGHIEVGTSERGASSQTR